MTRPRKSLSFPPATDWSPPAVAFFAALCAAFGAGRPVGPVASPVAHREPSGAVSEPLTGAARIAAAFR